MVRISLCPIHILIRDSVAPLRTACTPKECRKPRAHALIPNIPAAVMTVFMSFQPVVRPKPQSFCAALQQELTEYYRLLAVLEGQHQVGDAGIVGEGASGSLTLRRLMVWTYDPMMRLRTLAALVDACKGTVITQ